MKTESDNPPTKMDGFDVVQIDEHRLDRECIRLPRNYLRFAYQASEARRDVDELKAELKVTEAETDAKIRATPGKYGLEKVTESAVSSVIRTRPEYIEAEKKLRRAVHHQDLMQAVVSALETKKRSLTLLVELHGMGYFSNVKMTGEAKEKVEEMTRLAVRKPRRKDD